jgi:integrase/recombinase XerD
LAAPLTPEAALARAVDRASLPQYLTRDQVGDLVRAAKNDRDKLFIRVAFETGGRVSELTTLTESDFDLANRQIRLRTLKRRTDRRRRVQESFRWIPISDGLCADLSLWWHGLRSTSGLSATERVFAFTRVAAFKLIRSAGRRAGLVARGGRDVSPHILRHSFAMNCITQGVPINVLKELLGHASIANTMVYLKTDPAQAREFLRKVQF